MKHWPVTFALALLGAGLASKPAKAATATASFAVSATVVSSCQASPPSATTYGSFAATLANAASPLAVTCTLPTPYSVVARAAVASEARRAATRKTTGAGNGSSQSHPLGGHTTNEQDLPPVTPPDTITVTVSY
jgi:spore coat protein U-like protein